MKDGDGEHYYGHAVEFYKAVRRAYHVLACHVLLILVRILLCFHPRGAHSRFTPRQQALACCESMTGGRVLKCFVSSPPFLLFLRRFLARRIALVGSVMLWPRTDDAADLISELDFADFATMLEQLGCRSLTSDDKEELEKLGRPAMVASFERPDGHLLFSPGMMICMLQHMQFGGEPVSLNQIREASSNAGGMTMAMIDHAVVNTGEVSAWPDSTEMRCKEQQEDAQYHAGNKHLAEMFALMTSTLFAQFLVS